MHRIVLQCLLIARDLPPGKPSPPSKPPARGVEKPEIIPVADARDLPEDGAFAVERWRDQGCVGQTAEVGAVEGVGGQTGAGQEEDGEKVAGVAIVGPVGAVQGGGPRNGGVFLGRLRLWRSNGRRGFFGKDSAHCMVEVEVGKARDRGRSKSRSGRMARDGVF